MLQQMAQLYRYDNPMTTHMPTSYQDGWFTLVGFIVLIALVGVILLIVYKLATKPAASQGKDPIDIAKERLARGDISAEEFDAIKKALSSK